MKKLLAFVFVFALALSCLASGTSAQTVQGVITGTVTDPSGAAVPGATVTLLNSGTGATQTTTTGSDGVYRFSLVPPGSYVIDVKSTSFREVRTSGIVVEASQTVPFNVRLEIGSSSQVIEVVEQAALVQTATSDLAVQVDRQTIENAPLVDRDVFSTLPFIAPGVTPGMNLNPASGGARESGTAYLLNGADDNDNFSEGAVNIHPPLESVEDFSILTNSMGAQYGRGAGAVVSANQKSGTNRFHGALYEFNRNATLNANDFFYSRDYYNALGTDAPLPNRPKYIRNQFGGEVDGPIRRDKTFFSFAYDRIKLSAGATAANTFVPTSAALAYVEQNGGSLAQQVLAAYPPVTADTRCSDDTYTPGGTDYTTGAGADPNTGLPNQVGCLSFFNPQTDTQDAYYGRVDHNFGPSDRLSVAVNIFRESFIDTYGGGGLTTKGPINGATINHYHNIALMETHSFNPRVVNEVTVSHNRHYNTFIEGDGKDTAPNIYLDMQNEGFGPIQFGPYEGGQIQGFVQDRWQATDNLTWTKGRHSLKFGGGGQYGILYRNWDLGLPGQYEFGEFITVNGGGNVVTPTSDGTLQPDGTIANVQDLTASNFTGDYPYFQETSVDPATGAHADAYRHFTYHDYYWFVQDDWKVSSRLTLNLGLRWDRFGAPGEAHNIISQFTNLDCNILDPACLAGLRVGPVSRMWPTQNKDFGPRLGFAWDVFGNGKTAIRGGYGIYYDRIFDNIWSNGAWNPPFYALIDFEADLGDAVYYSNPASIGAAYDPNGPNGPIPYPGKRVSLRTMDQNMKDSSVQNFHLGIERQFFNNLLFRVQYQGSLGRHLPMLENYNRYDGDAYGVASPTSLTAVLPNALYNGFNYRSNSVTSSYHSLVLEAQKRLSHGLQFETSYTWSKLLDVNSDLFAGCSTIGGYTAPYYYVSNSQPAMYRGPASFDHKHAYKFSVTYELPFLKHQKGLVGQAFGGWSIGSFLQLYSGHPIDVYNGRTRIRARDSNGDFILDQNGVPFNIGGDYNLDGTANDHPDFIGSSLGAVYSHASPADGIFADNNKIGCAVSGVPSTVDFSASSSLCPSTPSTLFGNPAYGTGATPFERFGALGRGVFRGPKFVQMDLGLSKSFRVTEGIKLDFRAQAQNLLNHANFDCIDSNLNSATFGQAQCLTPFGLGAPKSRVMSLGLRLAF
jgi:Carboxypeptidase regulatory-like domain